jgi:hypothetical protein
LSVCDYLCDGGAHPGAAMRRIYPRLFAKRLLRMAMNVEPPAAVYNAVLNTPAFLALARMIYFNRRTVSVDRSFSATAQETRRKVICAPL